MLSIVLKVGSCGFANVSHAGLVHLNSHSAQMLAYKDCKADGNVQNLIWLEIVRVDLLKLSELMVEEIHGAGEFGTSLLKFADLRIMFLVKVEVIGNDVWNFGCFVLIHVNVLGKGSNGFFELRVTCCWFGEKLNSCCWLDAGASPGIHVRGAIVLRRSLSRDRRVRVLVEVVCHTAFHAVQPLAEQEDRCILGVEWEFDWRRGRG